MGGIAVQGEGTWEVLHEALKGKGRETRGWLGRRGRPLCAPSLCVDEWVYGQGGHGKARVERMGRGSAGSLAHKREGWNSGEEQKGKDGYD